MSTIIAHGKAQWGRSNKHKRVDPELEAEMEMERMVKFSPKSNTTEETEMLKHISDKLEAGDEIVGKVDGGEKPGASEQRLNNMLAELNKKVNN